MSPSGPDTITLEEGIAIMAEREYPVDMITQKFTEWVQRGDVVLIFQNVDLSHPDIGQTVAMPWTPDVDGPIPAHGPDSSATGMGWRYITKYIIDPEGHLL